MISTETGYSTSKYPLVGNKVTACNSSSTANSVSFVTIEEASPELLRLESSIRAISTAIHEIQQRSQFRAPVSAESRIPCKDRSKVFSHLATLLTTGSPFGRQSVAVTGGLSHSGFYINAVEMVMKDEASTLEGISSIRREVDPDHSTGSTGRLKLEKIIPSTKTLKELVNDKRPLSDITLAEHAGDVFQALKVVSQDVSRNDLTRSLECFILRRCRFEIHRRLHDAVELLDPPLHDLLNEWEISRTDDINEEWLVMPFPLTLIEHFAIPHRSMARSPERLELLFNRDTFSFWKKLFVSLLHVVITTLSGLKPEQSGSEKDVTQAHLALRFLRIFLSFGPARIILETPSLKNVLLKRIRSPQGDKWQYKNAPEQFPAKIILHAWKNVVAHDSAVSSLAAINCTVSMVLREYSPTMHVIHAFPPSDSKTMDSIPDIMRTKVIPALRLDKYNFSNSAIIDMLNALILQNLATPDFGGAVHCEATIMGIAYACSHGKYAKNELPFRTGHGTAFHNAFEGHSNTIGFSDKSCQICHWLSEELLLSNGYFHLRGCHGRTLPWSPPRLGIPLSVLQNLELVLLELLTDSTERWLKEEIRRTEGSRME